jgi:nickel-type superoxide dismutase maturation protease
MIGRLIRSWHWRVAVSGHSMEPTLRAGDWLLVDPDAYRRRAPQPGELVVARDPRLPERWLVKRVADALPDGRLMLAGDHPAHAADGTGIGPLGTESIVGCPWLRYWPVRRIGRIR